MQFSLTIRDLPARIGASGREFRRTRSVAGAGLLTAVSLVLKQLTLTVTQYLKIGFSFLGLACCAYWYGPVAGIACGALLDLLGFVFNPTGPYFIGFTLNEMLAGFLYGCWLYRRPVTFWRTLAACATVTLCVNLLLTPLWLQMLYGNAQILSAVRIVKNLLQLPVNTGLLYALLCLAQKYKAGLR